MKNVHITPYPSQRVVEVVEHETEIDGHAICFFARYLWYEDDFEFYIARGY